MDPIVFIDRQTGDIVQEKVYGAKALKFIYGNDWIARFLGTPLLHYLVKNPIFSAFYGWWQKQSWTKKKILPFIKTFDVNVNEFAEPVSQFRSFNDFFIRKLKKSARPIAEETKAIIPADGRYYFYQSIRETEGFIVKGEKFNLASLLDSAELAKDYSNATMVMARLCPSDYHRFHFPCDCTPSDSALINGWLYSVNPIAIKRDIHIFSKNKRMLTILNTQQFGKILFIEVGATNVGSIHQTYTPLNPYRKGEEKGYFSFGASALIILFEEGKIQLDQDLIDATQKGYEMRCLMGQSLGSVLRV